MEDITFEEFVNSRVTVNNVQEHSIDALPGPGYIYMDSFYLHIHSCKMRAVYNNVYHVHVGVDELTTFNLDEAEQYLFEQTKGLY